ncbi:conserved hypothetical protein [Crenothrix polyspora]|jgi:uncharacterized protein (DUF934 family)|uniref:Oxidoreductase probably involved in sulfite reduction n=1 Tax=Crenothrix polyspora TaxID=360316 RepID=A0A1R4HCP3_9GAMM|nr:DUF934 domain-containing protein [Crenothrix polyspora]SJM93977.1 conserved hypothetical protein [Crenothrix polyspora]
MKIIKDNHIVDNGWHYIAEHDPLSTGDITVSLARWESEKAQLLNHTGKLGVRLVPGDAVAALAQDLNSIQLIELDFPDLADGRLFSLAWLLRGRYGYQGEIRATGRYVAEQVYYLSRVGVNAFAPQKQEDLPAIQACLSDFSVSYQPSIN